jgi:protein-disulfide isomerase
VGAEPVANVQPAGSSVVDIQIYLDYLCPICKAFEAANSAQIEEWVKSGAATVEIHPISILDRSSQGTQYSTRAANTAACVANYSPNTFWALNQALFSKQPAEGSTGLTDDELIGIVKDVGAGSVDQISTCVKDQTYSTWVTSSTNRSETVPFPNSKITDPTKAVLKGTPTVLVNGLLYEGAANDATAFTAFVLQAAGSSFNSSSTASPTPTATPTPTPTPKK